jgi:hypothetical protein
MAAGRVDVRGLEAVQRGLQERARRIRDLTPVMKNIGQDIEKQTDDAIRLSRSPGGDKFKPIKKATILARASTKKGTSERTKGGKLTAKARRLRAELTAASTLPKGFGGAKPLVDTERLKGSRRTRPSKRSVQFSMVGYTGPHITGSKDGKLPKRNPTVFEFKGGRWRVVKHLALKYSEMITAYIEGKR